MKPKIEKAEFGNIIINRVNYGTKDLIVYWDRVEEREKSHFFSKEEFEKILERKPEIVIVGIGFNKIVNIDPDVEEIAKKQNIKLFVLPTEEACKKFNESTGKVVIVIHSTC